MPLRQQILGKIEAERNGNVDKMDGVLEGIDPRRETKQRDGPYELLYTPSNCGGDNADNEPHQAASAVPRGSNNGRPHKVSLVVKSGSRTVSKATVEVASLPSQQVATSSEVKAHLKAVENGMRSVDPTLDTYTSHSLLVSILRDYYHILPDVGGAEELPDVPDLLAFLVVHVFMHNDSSNEDEPSSSPSSPTHLASTASSSSISDMATKSRIKQFLDVWRAIHNKRREICRNALHSYRQMRPVKALMQELVVGRSLSSPSESSGLSVLEERENAHLKEEEKEGKEHKQTCEFVKNENGKEDNEEMISAAAHVSRISRMYWHLSFQRMLYERVLSDTIVQKYPPSLPYRKELVNALVTLVEDLNCEPYEAIIQYQADLCLKKNGGAAEEKHFRSYDFEVGSFEGKTSKKTWTTVTLASASSFSSISTYLWPAALTLVEFMLENPKLFKGKAVMELGSGTGFASSVLMSLGPRRVEATDFDEKGLATLKANLKINAERVRDKSGGAECFDAESGLTVSKLDWCSYEEEEVCVYPPDVVIGSDLVYSPDIIPGLINVLETCIKKARVEAIYLVNMLRNLETYSLFQTLLRERLLGAGDSSRGDYRIEDLPLPTRRFFCHQDLAKGMSGEARLIKISAKRERKTRTRQGSSCD
eukprot:jgi/Bigna1/70335/fgenesh1_pg.11_\